jgi:ADP-ribose pyrophosphatase YjhB (NUDIX family)
MLTSLFSWASALALRLMLGLRALVAPMVVGATAIVEDEAGRVLVVRHSYLPGWHFPGGGVGAGEAPAAAVLRELKEEVGLLRCAPPELVGVFTRRIGWVTNHIVLYRVRQAQIAFTPNLEIREAVFIDAAAPPPGTTAGTRRRLAELRGQAVQDLRW